MSPPDHAPPPPRRALRVGVTGHREIPAEELPALTAAVADVLRRIRAALDAVREAPGLDLEAPPRAVLVSPLAAGADQLVAEEALAQGYELAVPLPYEKDAYVRELSAIDDAAAQAARERFPRLYERAVSRLEVDAEPEAPDAERPGRPYEALGRLVVENCDLLLAVWDGGPGGGRGGTAHVVKTAHAVGLAVLRIHVARPQKDEAYRRRLPRAERGWTTGHVRLTVADGAAQGEGIEALDGKVQELLAPWSGPASSLRKAADPDHLAVQRRRLATFLAERPPQARSRPARLGHRVLVGLWRGFRRLLGGAGVARPEVHPAPSPRDAALAEHQAWASALADHYMPLYRGAFVAVYVLGALAVLSALVPLLCAATCGDAGPTGAWAAAVRVVHEFEALVLLTILALIFAARRGRWHERAIDYRILAELLRHTRWLAPLGLAAPNTRPRAHLASEVDLTLTWVVAHYRAVLRNAGMPAGRLDRSDLAAQRDKLAGEWITEQVEYHQDAAARHHHMGHVLERWVHACFFLALAACLAGFLVHGVLGSFLAAVAAGLPAVAAACHGIRTQGEMDRLSKRSASMARRLDDLRRRVRELEGDALAWPDLNERARQASQAMIEELDDWQALSRGLEINPP
jgi:hypothetical protein